jgi:hypothetical protein
LSKPALCYAPEKKNKSRLQTNVVQNMAVEMSAANSGWRSLAENRMNKAGFRQILSQSLSRTSVPRCGQIPCKEMLYAAPHLKNCHRFRRRSK